jgi:vanillate O-demethylase ferredoxin subunit
MAIRYEAPDIRSYVLRRTDGVAFPGVDPGAHIDLRLPGGIARSFSLSNGASDPGDYRITIARDEGGRGGSIFMHDQVRAGDVLTMSAPRNNFVLARDAASSLFIAGGIGITPIVPMLMSLNQLERGWKLIYCAKNAERAALRGEIERLAAAGRGELICHFSETAGRLNFVEALTRRQPDAHVYCCGPNSMLRDFRAASDQSGIPADRVHFEYFRSDVEGRSAGGFMVVLQRSGRQIAVKAGQTILEALQNENIEVPCSCLEGICGSCETRVISGTPDHRDMILTERERQTKGTMMICCSGAKSESLVLDL